MYLNRSWNLVTWLWSPRTSVHANYNLTVYLPQKKKKKDCTSIFVVLHFKWAGGLKNQKAKQLSPYKAELYRLAPQTYCWPQFGMCSSAFHHAFVTHTFTTIYITGTVPDVTLNKPHIHCVIVGDRWAYCLPPWWATHVFVWVHWI